MRSWSFAAFLSLAACGLGACSEDASVVPPPSGGAAEARAPFAFAGAWVARPYSPEFSGRVFVFMPDDGTDATGRFFTRCPDDLDEHARMLNAADRTARAGCSNAEPWSAEGRYEASPRFDAITLRYTDGRVVQEIIGAAGDGSRSIGSSTYDWQPTWTSPKEAHKLCPLQRAPLALPRDCAATWGMNDMSLVGAPRESLTPGECVYQIHCDAVGPREACGEHFLRRQSRSAGGEYLLTGDEHLCRLGLTCSDARLCVERNERSNGG